MTLERPDTAQGRIPLISSILDLRDDEKFRPLGETSRVTTHKLESPDLSHYISEQLNKQFYNTGNEDNLHFITVRPSPEHMYHVFNRVPSYDEQLQWFERNFVCDSLMTTSVEKGHDHTQILHYHITLNCSKKIFNKVYKHYVNLSTVLHKVYGYQKAVLESTKSHILHGFYYFTGVSVNSSFTYMKSDHYKLIVNKFLFKNKISSNILCPSEHLDPNVHSGGSQLENPKENHSSQISLDH